jgi:Ca2+-binding EF-hand superfamily protein
MTSPANWSDDHTLAKVKRILIEAGGIRGFADAAALFRQFDLNKNGYIDETEFNVGLNSIGAKLSKQELKYLILAFDKDRDGRISLKEFVGELVYPQMNWRRQRCVVRAFEFLKSKDQDGKIQPAEVRAAFDVSQHPAVRSGRVSADLIQKEFERAFDDSLVDENGFFDETTFKALFGGISSVVPSDDIFEEIITLGFHIDNAQRPTFSGTETDWKSTQKGQDPLEYSPHRPDDAYSKTLQQLARSKGYDQSVTYRPQPNREPTLPMLGRVWETTSRLAYSNPNEKK